MFPQELDHLIHLLEIVDFGTSKVCPLKIMNCIFAMNLTISTVLLKFQKVVSVTMPLVLYMCIHCVIFTADLSPQIAKVVNEVMRNLVFGQKVAVCPL